MLSHWRSLAPQPPCLPEKFEGAKLCGWAQVTGYAGGARISDPNVEDGAAKGPWTLILRIEAMLEAAPAVGDDCCHFGLKMTAMTSQITV